MKTLLTIGILSLTSPLYAQDSGAFLALRQASRDSDAERLQEYLDLQLEIHPNDPTLLEEAVLSSMNVLDLDTAGKYAQKLKANRPNSLAVEIPLLSLLIRDGKFEDAKFYAEKAENLKFVMPEVLHAWALAENGESKRALDLLKKIADQQEEMGYIFDYHRAMILANIQKDYVAALDVIAGNGDPIYFTDLSYYSHLALLKLAKSSAFQPFVEEKFGPEKTWPSDIVTLIKKLDSGQIPPSLNFASPQNAIGEYILGLSLALQLDRIDPTMQQMFFAMVPSLSPENSWFVHEYMEYFFQKGLRQSNYGDVVAANNEFDSVLKLSERINKNSFVYEPSMQTTVNALFLSDRQDEIRSWLKSYKAKLSNELAFKGETHRRLEEYQEAIGYFEKSLEISGRDQERLVAPIYGLAISYERVGEWPKAERNFLEALELQPDNPDILNYLGYSYVDRGEKLETGLEMIEKAVSLAPSQPHIIDSLGWAYYRLKRYEDAVEPLENATSLMSTDAIINTHLGDLYWQLGRQREARFQWERARRFLKEDTQDLSKAELNNRLENGL